MSLSEIQAAAAAAATTDVKSMDCGKNTGDQNETVTVNARVSPDTAERENAGGVRGRDVTSGAEAGEAEGWDAEEGDDGGGAGARARQRMRAGGRRKNAGHEREADLSVRYLMTKVR